MKKIGRNDPCHCGSGKKYKHCHLASEDANPRPAAQGLHDRQAALVVHILEWAMKPFGKTWAPKQLEKLVGHARLGEADAPFFLPWLAWHATPKKGVTAGAAFLAKEGPGLDAGTRALIEAELAGWVGVWRVRSARPEIDIELEDILTGETRSVVDRLASRQVSPGQLLLARVLDHDGLSIFAGVHPNALPGSLAPHFAEHLADLEFATGTPADLRSAAVTTELIQFWEVMNKELVGAGPPRVVNREGDEILFTTDRFDITPPDRESAVVTALLTIDGARRDHGAPKNRPTIVFGTGSAVVRRGTLVVESNSVSRADELRRLVEAACGSLLRHRFRHHADPMSSAAGGGDELYTPPDPEVAARVREYKEEHYRGWLDEALPALEGLTPRDAAKTANGRKRVKQLVDDIEHLEERLDLEERYDVTPLREALGLAARKRPALPKKPEPAPIDSAPERADAIFVVEVGPLTFEKGPDAVGLLPVRPDGSVGKPVVDTSEAKAMAAIRRNAGAGARLLCPTHLAAAGKKHGFVPALTPRTAFEARLSFALAMTADIRMAPQDAANLGAIALALYSTAPWRHWTSDDAVEVVLRAPDGATERFSASIMGSLGDVLGFAMYEPHVFEEIRGGTAVPAELDGISLTLDDAPEAAVRAFQLAFGMPFFPQPARVERGKLVEADDREIFQLIAVGRALAKLTPSSRKARGELVFDDGTLIADVTAPAVAGKRSSR